MPEKDLTNKAKRDAFHDKDLSALAGIESPRRSDVLFPMFQTLSEGDSQNTFHRVLCPRSFADKASAIWRP